MWYDDCVDCENMLMGVDKLGCGRENFCRDRIGMKLWDQEWDGGKSMGMG